LTRCLGGKSALCVDRLSFGVTILAIWVALGYYMLIIHAECGPSTVLRRGRGR
jgi:hypothetical protein